MKNKIYNSSERAEIIIQTFVNAVYLYDDKMVITFNFTDDKELKKLEIADLENIEKFGFGDARFTIAILSELLMFAVMVELRSR